MIYDTHTALKALLDALVSPDCTDAELPALFSGRPGSGDIIPAIINARATLSAKNANRSK